MPLGISPFLYVVSYFRQIVIAGNAKRIGLNRRNLLTNLHTYDIFSLNSSLKSMEGSSDETISKDHEHDPGFAHAPQLFARLGGGRAYRHRRICGNTGAAGGEHARGHCRAQKHAGRIRVSDIRAGTGAKRGGRPRDDAPDAGAFSGAFEGTGPAAFAGRRRRRQGVF